MSSLPVRPRRNGSPVTLAHLDDAIAAAISPLQQDIAELRGEVLEVADDVRALVDRLGARRRWLGLRATRTLDGLLPLLAAGAAGGLLAHFF